MDSSGRRRGRNRHRRSQNRGRRDAGQSQMQQSHDAFMNAARKKRFENHGNISSKRTIPISISTRGIGFMISHVTSILRQNRRLPIQEIPVAAMYRASLAQMYGRIRFASLISDDESSLRSQVKYLQSQVKCFKFSHELKYYSVNLSPVALIINSIGNVIINEKEFKPAFMKNLSPLNIRLDNLREYCDMMSDQNTDYSVRKEGYELNSIPNAKWERENKDDPQSIILKNPTEIIPADYDCTDVSVVRQDLIETTKYIQGISPYLPDMKATISDSANGDASMLISTHVVPGESLMLHENVISGVQNEFWSSEPVNGTSTWCKGVIGLIGEVQNPMISNVRYNIGGRRSHMDWHEIVHSIV